MDNEKDSWRWPGEKGEHLTREDLCAGCYNDFYNRPDKKCFSFDDSKVIRRVPIHIDAMPPYKNRKTKDLPNCYTKQRMVYVNPEQFDDEGYLVR